ncbi:hypothetical protein EC957_004202 [Mortierella hygrophila]|uniref:F-box domain-containing protein n=1 Tax=Mortierella hygrophila TaxID=979708 RepID=A0A9P6FFH1_9FUNG|nr:hypothetical protein EC957_004202 [Mortierella hygrophila]
MSTTTTTVEGSIHDSGVDSLDDYDSDSDYLYTSSDDEQENPDSSTTKEHMTPDQVQQFQQLQLEQREHRRALRQEIQQRQQQQRRRRRRDVFSTLPAPVLQQILARLPPFQMLIISELSRRFYNFVVLGQDMNEVWFRLVKHEEAEEKKLLDWYKLKKLEQEHRSVQMLRSYSNSSTSSNMSSASYGNGYGPADEHTPAISKQAQRLLNKKQESTSGKSTSTVKAMRRNDRKKNWCKIYVDTILRGNGEDPLEALNQIACGPAKRPVKFQTLSLNEPLPLEYYKDDDYRDADNGDKALSREARTQAKLDKRMYYKSIRSKPKGKKAGQMDSAAAKIDKISSWRQPEWTQQDQVAVEEY